MATSSNTTEDPTGRRTVVTLHDDRGEPYKFVSNGVSILGSSLFSEVISIPLSKDDGAVPPRPSLVRGQILIGVSIAVAPATVDYALTELQVLGYVGSTSTLIAHKMLGGQAAIMRVTFEDDDTFDRIGINARQIVNGLPSTDIVNVTQNSLTAVALMWS